jgi:hypothetical protein
MRDFLKKSSLWGFIFLCCLFFASCAMIFPVSSPNLSQKEYTAMLLDNNDEAHCYTEKTRYGMVALDVFFLPALLVDALGGYYTYYAYNRNYCVSRTKPEPVVQQQPRVENKVVQSQNTRPIFVAVLESVSGGVLQYQETQFITNVLREEAVKALSSDLKATIMTRENIREMLPPEKSLEDCEGSCLVETGKNISADYVSQARIGTFGKNLTISVELYKTSNNKLVSSFNTKAQDIDTLEERVRERAPDLFGEIIREETDR